MAQVLFPFRADGIVEVVRHLAQAQHLDSMLSGQGAIQGEVDQMVAIRVEQYAVIGAPLVTMGQDVFVKTPTLHITHQKAEWAFFREYRKDFLKMQKGGRLIHSVDYQRVGIT